MNTMLSLFKEQLESECSRLGQEYGLSKRGDLLIYWYFTRLYDLSETDVAGIICDGFDDLGIDAIWIDDTTLVHFYSFKNPRDVSKGFPGGDVDKTISGLKLILNRRHEQIANDELLERLEEVYGQVPSGYRLHFVTSGQGVSHDSQVKLDSLIGELAGTSEGMVSWDEQPLDQLQATFYQQRTPAIDDPLMFDQLKGQPYMLQSGTAESYFFHVSGAQLADLYETHREALLQRNIRIDQRGTPTNRSIEATCTGPDAPNFLHFNNGVTFLCNDAAYDPFRQTVTLQKAQVVNGGQTIRAIWRARQKGALQPSVLVAARAITFSGDNDFANSVAVNQNNQNKVRTGFLRSNDPKVVQLGHALEAKGYYLERRRGEARSLTDTERAAILNRIRQKSLSERVIKLNEGAQAYTATFHQQPELAKKNPGRIFLSTANGGQFERVFSSDMTAEKVVIAYKVKVSVDDFVRRFWRVRRKIQDGDDVASAYTPVVGPTLAAVPYISQVVPQCSLFVCATMYMDLVNLQGNQATDMPAILDQRGDDVIREHLGLIVDYAEKNRDKADQSWPTLLKSNSFFSHIAAHLSEIRRGRE